MTETLDPTTRLSGWCGPAVADGRPHPTDHARCQTHIDAGRVSCDCPDHRKDTP